ncbi:MAG: hypothetical protein ABR508_08245 [Candidatus Baltobacteraceae bacterium]
MAIEALAGVLAGLAARYVLPDSPGLGSDTLVGLLGGGLAAFVYKLAVHRPAFDAFDGWSIAAAACGGFALIALVRMGAGRRIVG